MNEKITLPGMAQLLALRSGDSKKQAEDFLKELFSYVADLLTDGEQIKIKDIGVFKTIVVEARKSVNVQSGQEVEIPSHRKVIFTPAKELASVINEPFEMFETVELSGDMAAIVNDNPGAEEESECEDTYVDDTPDAESSEVEPTTEVEPTKEVETAEVENSVAEETIEVVSENSDETPEYVLTESDQSDSPELSETSQESDTSEDPQEPEESETVDNEYHEPQVEKSKKRTGLHFWLGLLSGVAAVLLIEVISLFALGYINFDKPVTEKPSTSKVEISKPVETEKTPDQLSSVTDVQPTEASPSNDIVEEKQEAEEVAPTQPSDQKEYDTITKTRYLTTMAKDHYGNYNLWPYIYEENKEFLGHPDRIKPGTRVVVPDLKKYGVDPKNPEDIAKAKKKGVEIYSRYR